MQLADDIVRQFYHEFEKVNESSARAANALAEKAEIHEKLQQEKFTKYLEGRSRSASLDIIRLELEKEQRCYSDAEKEIALAEQNLGAKDAQKAKVWQTILIHSSLKETVAERMAHLAEQRERGRIDELKKSALTIRKSGMDIAEEQSMRDMYQDMIDKLAEMHSSSRLSQKSSLAKERSTLDEKVSSMNHDVDKLQKEVDALNTALEATGYSGLLHESRRSAILMMKNIYTAMKDELLQLRLATHTMRIRARTAQANLAIEK